MTLRHIELSHDVIHARQIPYACRAEQADRYADTYARTWRDALFEVNMQSALKKWFQEKKLYGDVVILGLQCASNVAQYALNFVSFSHGGWKEIAASCLLSEVISAEMRASVHWDYSLCKTLAFQQPQISDVLSTQD